MITKTIPAGPTRELRGWSRGTMLMSDKWNAPRELMAFDNVSVDLKNRQKRGFTTSTVVSLPADVRIAG